jgi:hypothetical protein
VAGNLISLDSRLRQLSLGVDVILIAIQIDILRTGILKIGIRAEADTLMTVFLLQTGILMTAIPTRVILGADATTTTSA